MGMSKGIQVYFFSAVEGASVEFSVPGQTIKKDQFRVWSSDHLEVEGHLTGRFEFKVHGPRGAELTHQWVDVNTLTGSLEQGTMAEIEQMHTVTANGMMIAYGLYDAGHGEFGLPNAHQCHVTVSREQPNWMGEVAPRGSPAADKKASCFALPCAHDPGMSTMDNVDTILKNNAGKVLSEMLSEAIKVHVNVAPIVRELLPAGHIRNIVYALSVTQKDNIMTMLQMGARYFEYRPGKLPHNLLQDEFYFLHLVIPGLAYTALLDTLLDFLGSHPDEIVFVQLRHDGIPAFIERFDDATMDSVAEETVKKRNNGVQAGNLGDLKDKTIKELRESNKRLLITKQDHVSQYSSYDDTANATLVPGPMIEQYEKMNAEQQRKDNPTFTILQCQATATNIPDVLKYSIASSDASTSVMMATKAICDVGTHPWIQNNGGRLSPEHLLVIMNDWIDGATCDVAIELSKHRFEQADGH